MTQQLANPEGYNKGFCGNHDDLYCRANSTKGPQFASEFDLGILSPEFVQVKDLRAFVMQPAALQLL